VITIAADSGMKEARFIWEFFYDRISLPWDPMFAGTLYVPSDKIEMKRDMEDVAGAVGYDHFVGNTCVMHIIVQDPKCITRHKVRKAFEFPFKTRDLEYVLAFVDSKNERALDFDRQLGFKDIITLPNGGHAGDLVILSMSRSECRWIR